jgi:hypothetical protein
MDKTLAKNNFTIPKSKQIIILNKSLKRKSKKNISFSFFIISKG